MSKALKRICRVMVKRSLDTVDTVDACGRAAMRRCGAAL
ncbi:hypothetical protein BURPS668_A1014 [Burkholderia pseudomallei 668]|nr:hypothetical protein BURPS668_A1014 [Burkholderia pseudomallei 668]